MPYWKPFIGLVWGLLPCSLLAGPPRHNYGLDRHVGYVVMTDKTDTLFGIIRLTAPETQHFYTLEGHNNSLELTQKDGVSKVIYCKTLSMVRVYPSETIYADDSICSREKLREDDHYGRFTDYKNLDRYGLILWKCIAYGKARVFIDEFNPAPNYFDPDGRFCIEDSASVKTIRAGLFRYTGRGIFKRFINARYGTAFKRRDFASAGAAIDFIAAHG